ncbi:transporter substrate-binding domain-containing protein [Clostridium sp. BJN0001]|uniref:transporter substrate-binding domain-containing protein n=1 Tax=Clostridium sp. BJN0001 TaxID=2930219 RepID=UPI001FD329EE|nr:transporter substrate-binding domain-containing protein [Clostridium sp. BJN0001]
MKNKILKRIIGLAAVAVLSISMVGCGNNASSTGSSDSKSKLEQIKEKGKLVVGTSADFPPYEFHSNSNGEDQIIGIDISIANEVAKDLGVELEVKDMDFDGLLIALQGNKVDMIFSGMTPKPERKENADFSDIYYNVKQTYIVRKEDEGKIKTEDDLKGLKVGAQKGSVQEDLAKSKFDAENIKSLTKVTDLILDLKNKKIDAILLEVPIAEFNASQNDDLAVAPIEFEDEDGGYAIAMPKDSPELVKQVNGTIKRLQDDKKIDEFASEMAKLID